MRSLVLGTAGHIDHGKTALVRALTGKDTHHLPAEKQRGITIDLGFAALALPTARLAIIDVPGHERFVRNMLAGATGIDLALLVVAADDSVMPQTREHLEILQLLGLTGGAVALTKCDLADANWLDLVEEEVRGLVAGTFLEQAPIVRTSSATGLGVDRLRETLATLAGTVLDRDEPGPFRLAIDRAFTVAGHGTVVTGTIASGQVRVGDELTWWPAGRMVRVRGLQSHDQSAPELDRGTRAAVNLVGVHHTEIARGQELATPGYLVPARTLTALFHPARDATRPLRHRGRYRLHLGTAEVAASVSLLPDDDRDPAAGRLIQVVLASPLVAVHGQPFVLREESPPATLGGGRILEPAAPRLRRRDQANRARVAGLQAADAATRAAAYLARMGHLAWTPVDLCREAGIPLDHVPAVLEHLQKTGELVTVPIGPRRRLTLTTAALGSLEDRMRRALARLHEARPRQTAIRRAHVAAEVPDLDRDGLLAAVLDRLAQQGLVQADALTVALRGHQPRLSQAERKLKAELQEACEQGGFSPPDVAELTARAGARAPVVRELLQILVDEGRLVDIGGGIVLAHESARLLETRVSDHLVSHATMTMADLRDLLGTTRKYAVPIGEYLDRIGQTVRDGDLRRLGAGSQPPGEPGIPPRAPVEEARR